MANAPLTQPDSPKTRFNETGVAIGASLLIGIVLATLLTGNPLRAVQLAYLDYSHTPAGGAEKASDVRAPATQGPRN